MSSQNDKPNQPENQSPVTPPDAPAPSLPEALPKQHIYPDPGYIESISERIDQAYELADDKLIGTPWGLVEANAICEALQNAQYLAREVLRLREKVISLLAAYPPSASVTGDAPRNLIRAVTCARCDKQVEYGELDERDLCHSCLMALAEDDETPQPQPVATPADAVTLTAGQRKALEAANSDRGVWNKHRDNKWKLSVAPLQVLRKLETMGLIEPINSGDSQWSVQYIATDAGRAALKGGGGND